MAGSLAQEVFLNESFSTSSVYLSTLDIGFAQILLEMRSERGHFQGFDVDCRIEFALLPGLIYFLHRAVDDSLAEISWSKLSHLLFFKLCLPHCVEVDVASSVVLVHDNVTSSFSRRSLSLWQVAHELHKVRLANDITLDRSVEQRMVNIDKII